MSLVRGTTRVVAVEDQSLVGEARRLALGMAEEQGFSPEEQGRLALVVTELGTNLVKHASAGQILIVAADSAEGRGLEVIALDRGAGIPDVPHALRDGVSTTGTGGSGLGAVRRLASEFDIHSSPAGTAVLARVLQGTVRGRPSSPVRVGGVCVPHPGEEVAGDDWEVRTTPGGCRVMVADGLGHGPIAHEAAGQALSVFRTESLDEPPARVVEACHGSLRVTRGAAVAVADLDLEAKKVEYCAVGNIAAVIAEGGPDRHLASINGTVGHGPVRSHQFSYAWPDGGILILTSDGLQTHWTLEGHRGLAGRDPALIAGVLYRDHARGRDDSTVVVIKDRAA